MGHLHQNLHLSYKEIILGLVINKVKSKGKELFTLAIFLVTINIFNSITKYIKKFTKI